MDKPQSTKAFLQELNSFLQKFKSPDVSEVEWEKGDYGFKATFGSRKKEVPSPLKSNGKGETTPELMRVISPVVGTFHFPESEMSPGTQIKANDFLGIVKSVNVEHRVETETGGKLLEVHVREGEPVEFGQVLFTLEVL